MLFNNKIKILKNMLPIQTLKKYYHISQLPKFFFHPGYSSQLRISEPSNFLKIARFLTIRAKIVEL